jgi:OPA family glycerol-3-phosphate transporter-like MFS transporter
MFEWLKPAPHITRLSNDKIDPLYKRLRLQIFFGIFFGYAGFYLVRKNFTLAMPGLIDSGYTKTQLGFALSGISIAYGLSKFIMGNISDRSNPRFFLTMGLLLSAAITLFMGFSQWALSSVSIMFALLFINGWVQGMGWPPEGRTIVHWWSHRERGQIVALWNTSHNVGGGVIAPLYLLGMYWFNDWHSAFYVPATLAIVIAIFAFFTMRDTPQSVGLPSIEEYKNDYPKGYDTSNEKELSGKEIFFQFIFKNKLLWFIAFANVFVYLIRYGVLDWAPTYLKEAKGFTLNKSSWSYFLYEWAGIPGTLLCGWVSDIIFKGRRAPAGILFMSLVGIALLVYWLNPAGHPNIDMIALISIGFLIYGPVMLIGLHALELAPKKAAGTAAGFTGFFGYVGGSVAASALLGWTVEHFGWNGGFIVLFISCLLAILFIALTVNGEIENHNNRH